MTKVNLERLFNPRTVCVIGASNNRNKVGSQVLSNLLSGEKFAGKIFPINPKHETLFGLKSFKSIKEIREDVDLAVITIPNSKVPTAIEDCVDQNVKFAVIITAGFGEMQLYDTEGINLKEKILRIIRKTRLHVVGPNCMGIVSSPSRLTALMGLGIPPIHKKVNASIISQSGTWMVTTMRAGTIHSLGFSKLVSSGNEIDLKFEDYLEYLGLEDPDTQIIMGFIEGLRDGRRFIKLVEEIEKPIILIKGGKTEGGQNTAKSHTGSIAGSYQICQAVFKQYGVIEVNSMQELVDFGRAFSIALSRDPPKFPRGNQVGIFSGGGGACVLMADTVEQEGLVLAELTSTTIEKLNKILPPYWSHRNPVDLVASWDFSSYSRVLKVLLDDPNVDSIVARPPLGFSLAYENEDVMKYIQENSFATMNMPVDLMRGFDLSITHEMGRIAKQSSKPVIMPLGFYSPENPKEYEIIHQLHKRGILVTPSHSMAMQILRKLGEYFKSQQRRIKRNN
ncbi:MAG: acetate--CoA ligase family protein [Candidatus Helarchaeota archaeon]